MTALFPRALAPDVYDGDDGFHRLTLFPCATGAPESVDAVVVSGNRDKKCFAQCPTRAFAVRVVNRHYGTDFTLPD